MPPLLILDALLPGWARRAYARAYVAALNLVEAARARVEVFQLLRAWQRPARAADEHQRAEAIERLASVISGFQADGSPIPPAPDGLLSWEEGRPWTPEEIARSNAAYHRRAAEALRAALGKGGES